MKSNKLYNQYRADKEARKAMEKEAEIAEAYQQRAQQLAVAERQRLDALKSEIISKLKNAEKLAKVVGKQFDGFEYLAMQMSKLEQKSQKRQVPDFDTSELDAATAALFK